MGNWLKMSEDDYRALKALNQSRLALFAKSPLHYKTHDPEKPPTKSQRFGTLFHMAVLEPSRFKGAYALEPEFMPDGEPINRRVKKHREYLAFWNKENEGKIPVTAGELETITGMLTSLSSNEEAIKYFQTEMTERVAVWDHNGRLLKAKADAIIDMPGMGRTVVDLKTTSDASEKGFEKSIYNYCYFLQAYWYLTGFQAQSFVFVAIESGPPYAIGIYRADQSIIDLGEMKAKRWLEYLDWCEKNDKWPGYTKTTSVIGLPAWVAHEEQTLNGGE